MGRAGPGEALAFLRGLLTAPRASECIPWPFDCSTKYPKVWEEGERRGAHAVMCRMAHGERPSPKHEAAHSCGRGASLKCVNPAHLRWATSKENNADRVEHGTDPARARNPNAKLTETQVASLRARYRHGHVKRGCADGHNESLAAEFGISLSEARLIAKHRTWKGLPHA